MEIKETALAGINIIVPSVFDDARGYFFESYKEDAYTSLLNGLRFVQDNISRSTKGTIRGLHYQAPPFAQGKLCQAIVGTVLDVVVDIREGSPTLGKSFSVELSEQNKLQIWIPPGFAHGFSVLSDEAVFMYKCTAIYHRQSERAIRFNDPTLKIDWKTTFPKVSEKDLTAPLFDAMRSEFKWV
jgi:dTDP-4-dehydrorhamnose 3,5-epimerase